MLSKLLSCRHRNNVAEGVVRLLLAEVLSRMGLKSLSR